MITISIKDFLDRIKYEESYVSEEYETTTVYFIAPVEILSYITGEDFPDAVSAEISIEFPCVGDDMYFCAGCASVEISPTCEGPDGSLLDYEWYDVDLPYEDIDRLIDIYGKAKQK